MGWVGLRWSEPIHPMFYSYWLCGRPNVYTVLTPFWLYTYKHLVYHRVNKLNSFPRAAHKRYYSLKRKYLGRGHVMCVVRGNKDFPIGEEPLDRLRLWGILFLTRQQKVHFMDITQSQIESTLSVHNQLWNYFHGYTNGNNILTYNDAEYIIQQPSHKGFVSVTLPNSRGKNFLWITQNLNKTTYGSMAIAKYKSLGKDHRITWVVDTSNGDFKYRSNITTVLDSDGSLLDGTIEIYDSLGRAVVWSKNKMYTTRKAQF